MSDNPFKGPGDDELKKMKGQDPNSSDPKPKSLDDSLVTGKGGGAAAKDTLEARKQALPKEEETSEPYNFPTTEKVKSEDSAKSDTAILSDPKWPEPDTFFHQEVEVSVKLTTPPGKEHITKVQGELFAKTATGKESISKSEGHAQADGRAILSFPVYKPKGHEGGLVEYFIEFTHKIAKLLSTVNILRPVSETALKSADHILVPGISFTQDSSFINPKAAQGLKRIEGRFNEWEKKFPNKAQIAVYGHTDKGEKDAKRLSERRAQSAFAFITNDAGAWDKLYGLEKWGLKTLQTLLKDLGHYHGTADGQDGPNTQEAFKGFQKSAGLPESGSEDSATRKAMFGAYMKGKHDIQIDTSRFCQVAGNPWMGCASNNAAKESEKPAPENRRVAFILIIPSKNFPVNFPCQDGSEAACQGQCKKAGKRSAPGIKCLFYDELVREEKQEAAPVEEKPAEEKTGSDNGIEDGKKIIAAAKGWVGTPYVTGGNNKNGADCSGSVCGIYADANLPFPRVSSYDFPSLTEFKKSPGNVPQIGDVGFWPGHLMIFDPNAGTTSKGEAANGWSATHPDGKAFGVARYQWFDEHYNVPVVWYRYSKKKE